MEPNLLIGDRLFVSKYSYGYSQHSFPFSPKIFTGRILEKSPKRGDVVVFKTPVDNRTDYIKRLIGLPGDKVQIINKDLYLNDVKIEKRKVETSLNINCGDKIIQIDAYEETLSNGKKYLTVYRKDGTMINTDEYIVPKWNVDNGGMLKLPDSISFDEAAMIEPLACCIRSWNKFKHKKGDTAVVLGVGPTGIMHVMLAVYYEFKKVFCLDLNDFRLAYAKKFDTVTIRSDNSSASDIIKSQTGNKGVDVVIIATGNLKVLHDAINFVRKGGTIIIFGVPSKGDKIDLNMSDVYSKNITIINTYAASDIDTKEALEMISTKKINVKQLITHKYNLSDVQKAFEHAKTGKDAMKIIINN